jgi:hypothetical protein
MVVSAAYSESNVGWVQLDLPSSSIRRTWVPLLRPSNGYVSSGVGPPILYFLTAERRPQRTLATIPGSLPHRQGMAPNGV